MDKKLVAGILIGIFSVVALALAFPLAESNIPPTDAIQTIFVDSDPNDNVTAFTWDGNATFISGAGITILADYANSELTFSSGAGSATWEQLTNVTDVGCASGQVRKASGGQWVCANDDIGDSLTLEQLTNVTDVGCASGQVRKASGGQWVCANDDNTGSITTMESLTNVTDAGCADGQVRTASGGQWVCSTISSGATTLDSLTDVTITSVAYKHIIQYSQALGQWINKAFSIDSLTPANDIFIIGINNATGAITTNQFSVNTISPTTDLQIIGINNVTGHVTTNQFSVNTVTNGAGDTFVNGINNATGHVTTKQFSVNSLTCSGTDKISSINNATGHVICTTDSTGGGGSGTPLPPKKWGTFTPRSTGGDLHGLVATCTFGATATFVYDTTDNSNAVLSTTAVTDGVNGGIGCVATNTNSFRGDQNAYMYARWEENKITTNRIFIGFTSSATLLPNNADTILDALSGAGLCIRTTDTVYQFCSNDGTGAMAVASLTTTEDTGVHFFEVYTTDAGVTWCGKLDGGTAVCSSTVANIPAPTTRMYAMSQGETDGGGSAILWTQYQFYIQSDK